MFERCCIETFLTLKEKAAFKQQQAVCFPTLDALTATRVSADLNIAETFNSLYYWGIIDIHP